MSEPETPVPTGSDEAGPGDPNLQHLFARLALVESRVRQTVAARRAVDPEPDDPFRGLYVSEDAVARLLADGTPAAVVPDPAEQQRAAEIEQGADRAEAAGADLRLRRLARGFDLLPLDVDVLLVAIAPDIDPRFERLYGYLNDDVTRRRASVGLALTMSGSPEASATARSRFDPDAPLVAGGLMVVEDQDRPLLSRALRVGDRTCRLTCSATTASTPRSPGSSPRDHPRSASTPPTSREPWPVVST